MKELFRHTDCLPLVSCTSVSLNSTTIFRSLYSDISDVMDMGSSVKMQLEIAILSDFSLTKAKYHIYLLLVGL